MTRRTFLIASLVALPALGSAQAPLPGESPIRFAIIGDSGSGRSAQYQLAERLVSARQAFPYDFVLMMGDNIYGREQRRDFEKKFERPYKPLLDAGVRFYATLGNHDDASQRDYEPFNMGGRRYHSFSRGPVTFFAMDTTSMDRTQLEWLERELAVSRARWKVAYGHHPFYSSGQRHGSKTDLRRLVEPLLVKYGVDVVFAGHEHFYERITPQQNVHYFISGAAGKVRRGNIEPSAWTAAGFDRDLSFMLVEIEGDELRFQAISRAGEVVDRGTIVRPAVAPLPPR